MDSPPIGIIDSLFLDLEQPATLNIVASLSIHDPATAPEGFVRHRDVLGYLNGRLHIAPEWRQKLVFNPFKLEEPRLVDDPDFDLEFHVRHIALPSPHDERQLKILAARLFSRPMDINRPLWELYVIEGLDKCESFPPNSFALLIKLHHAVFDGASALKAMDAIYQRTPDEAVTPPNEPWSPKAEPSLLDWAKGSTTHYFKRVAETVTAMPGIYKSAFAEAQAIIKSTEKASAKEAVPATRFQAPITSHRVFDWLTIPFDRFNAARLALGKPKVNDFMYAIIGGGLRRYLLSHDELPQETLVSLCPLNIRPKNASEVTGNQVAFMRLPLGTMTADPIERIRQIANVSTQKKKHVLKTGGTLIFDILGMVPYPVRSFIVRNLAKRMSKGTMKPIVNATITNVPQPPGEFYFAGARVVTRVGLAPLFSHIGLTIVVSSSSHEAIFAVTSCREMMPDIAHFIDCLRESFEEIEGLALAQDKPVAPPAKPRAAKAKTAGSGLQ